MISGPKVLIDAEGEAVPMLEFKKISSVLVAIRFSCNISRYGIKFKRLRLTYKRERRERPTEINEREEAAARKKRESSDCDRAESCSKLVAEEDRFPYQNYGGLFIPAVRCLEDGGGEGEKLGRGREGPGSRKGRVKVLFILFVKELWLCSFDKIF